MKIPRRKGPAAENAPDTEQILKKMSPEEMIGQMLIPSFRRRPGDVNLPVTEPDDEIRACLAGYHFGGVLLFGENFRDPEQTLRLTADMQETNKKAGGLPLLFCTDQEGGRVARMKYGTAGPGNRALAATKDPENARIMAGIYGKELRLLGIHADLAPVVDINNNPDNPVIGPRSFSDDPEVTAAFGTAFTRGLHDAGTMACLKHFPGHGNTDTDSHTGFPCIRSTREELEKFELIPFKAAIDAGADMVMTAHIQYPGIETRTRRSVSTGEQVYLPATMSRVILTDLLRGRLGFQGVILSDALDMAAVSGNFSPEDFLSCAVEAGVNMLLLPAVRDAVSFRKMRVMTETAVRMVKEGRMDMERVKDSVRRILALKSRYGLLQQTDFTVTQEMVRAPVSGIGTPGSRETAERFARPAL